MNIIEQALDILKEYKEVALSKEKIDLIADVAFDHNFLAKMLGFEGKPLDTKKVFVRLKKKGVSDDEINTFRAMLKKVATNVIKQLGGLEIENDPKGFAGLYIISDFDDNRDFSKLWSTIEKETRNNLIKKYVK